MHRSVSQLCSVGSCAAELKLAVAPLLSFDSCQAFRALTPEHQINSTTQHNVHDNASVYQGLKVQQQHSQKQGPAQQLPCQHKQQQQQQQQRVRLHPLGPSFSKQAASSAQLQSTRALLQQPWGFSSCLHTAPTGGGSSTGLNERPGRSSSSTSSGAEQISAKGITRLVRDATDVWQLQSVVLQHSSAFNAINIAAAFTRAAHILTNKQQQQQQRGKRAASDTPQAAAAAAAAGELQQLLQQLTTLWQQQLQCATPREFTSVLLGCSKLMWFDQLLWINTLLALLQHLGEMNSQDASSAAYALATAAAANNGHVPGLTRQQEIDAVLTLTSQVYKLVSPSSSSSSSSGGSGSGVASAPASGRSRGDAVAAQAISNLLWSLAKLEAQPPMHELSGLLQGLAKPLVLDRAAPLAVVNTLWAVSELQQLPDWARNAESAFGTRASLGSASILGQGGKQQQQQQQQMLPEALLSGQQLDRLAKSSSQAVSNTVLAISRFASGPQPHLLEVPVAQQHIRTLLQGPTAATLGRWNAQDVGNAVYAAAQVGVVEPTFMQAVIAAAPQWLPDAGPATIAQVALGFARLKLRHHSDFLEALVLRGKQLLLQHDHHQHGSNSSSSSSSSIGSIASSAGALQADLQQQQQQQQQQQAMCECLATDLSWSIAVLNHAHLAKEIAELIRASGVKQGSALHPKNARRLWVVHAWLDKHRLAGGHGLQRLLTEQQLAFCAAASRHTARLTPPAAVVQQLQAAQAPGDL